MPSPKVTAAGQAASSWARARRAKWTTVPLPRPAVPVPPPKAAAPPAPAALTAPYVDDPEPIETDAEAMPDFSGVRQTVFRTPASPGPVAVATPAPAPVVEEERAPMSPWVWKGAIAAGIVAALAAGGSYVLRGVNTAKDKVVTLAGSVANTANAPAPPKTTGSLKVSTTPDGAHVQIDGKPRGKTPLTVDGLSFGEHKVTIESAQGNVQRTVTVTADAVAQLDEQIFDGWVAVFSPIEVVISEGTKVLRPDERNEIMLAPGSHRLRFINTALALDDVRTVLIKPGEKTALNFAPPKSTVSVTASDAAEVFLDGAKIGDAPVAASAAIGTHELVVRRASGGEKRQTIIVTTKPFSVSVTF